MVRSYNECQVYPVFSASDKPSSADMPMRFAFWIVSFKTPYRSRVHHALINGNPSRVLRFRVFISPDRFAGSDLLFPARARTSRGRCSTFDLPRAPGERPPPATVSAGPSLRARISRDVLRERVLLCRKPGLPRINEGCVGGKCCPRSLPGICLDRRKPFTCRWILGSNGSPLSVKTTSPPMCCCSGPSEWGTSRAFAESRSP